MYSAKLRIPNRVCMDELGNVQAFEGGIYEIR
jgi:hypothetical protein